jgi:hypothetical protein
MTYLSLFRKNLAALSSALADAANVSPSSIGKYVARDPKFFASCQEKDIRAGTYDFILARFSALWPDHLPWPDGVDRPAASPIEPETLDWFLPRLKPREKADQLPSDWPKGQPWPDDIEIPENANG